MGEPNDEQEGGSVLRPLRAGDHAALVGLFTDPGTREFLGGPVEAGLAEARASAWIAASANEPLWAIRGQDGEGALRGYVLLGPHHDGMDLEVSYALLPEWRGRGLATTALRRALEFAFRDLALPKVIAETQARNRKSIELLERLGMSPEGNVVRFGEEQVIYGIHRMLTR